MNGLVYYNVGLRTLLRLIVSLYTCYKKYTNDITILCDVTSLQHCKKIADYFGVNVKRIDLVEIKRKGILLNKCLTHKYTPYDNTILLDVDTLVLKDFSELHGLAEKYHFVTTKFCDVKLSESRTFKNRVEVWNKYYPELIEEALKYDIVINTGVYAFINDSELMRDWFKFAEKGIDMFIPDETCCQLILFKYKHYLVDSNYNLSCKFQIPDNNTKIIHFHGRKHCRLNNDKFIYNSNLWYKMLIEIYDLNKSILDCYKEDNIFMRYVKGDFDGFIEKIRKML